MITGGGVSLRRVSLIGGKNVVGGALAVVAPPLGALGRVVGTLAWASGVRGVVT